MTQIRVGRPGLEPLMRRRFVAFALTAGVAGVFATAGAASASADGTPVSFTVAGAGLSITPSTSAVNLGTATASLTGSSVTGSLGATTVTDLRGIGADWTVSVTGPATAFTDAAGDTVADSAATVWVPSVTASPTLGALRTDLHLTQLTGVALSNAAQALVTQTNLSSNTATFTPSIAVSIPGTALAGTYAGTVTQTVS